MSDPDVPLTLLYVDQCIEAYASRCRSRIPAFVEKHFSLGQTWALQRPTLWQDLFLAPINSAWAIPYLAIKKTLMGLETLGVTLATRALLYLPSGIKTGYQREVEKLISREVLEWDVVRDAHGVPHGLVQELKKHPMLEQVSLRDEPDAARSLHAVVESFSAGGAFVSSILAALFTIALGWFLLGSGSLGLGEIADRLARRNARERAAARFFLGRKVGSGFYRLFPPKASQTETIAIFLVLGAAVAVAAMVFAIASDPVRKIGRLHERRLSALLDNVEKELMVASQKRIKRSLVMPRTG
jgi:hypothetical protein